MEDQQQQKPLHLPLLLVVVKLQQQHLLLPRHQRKVSGHCGASCCEPTVRSPGVLSHACP